MAPPDNSPNIPEKTLISWAAPARLYQSRNRQFYSTAVVIFILVSVILAIAGEWMLIATLGALIFAYYVWTSHPPDNVEHSITNLGVRAHDRLFRWESLNRWWINSQWHHQVLNIDTPLVFPNRLLLILDPAKAKDITEIMTKHLLMETPALTNMDKAGAWLARKFPLDKDF